VQHPFRWDDVPLESLTPLISRRVIHGAKTTAAWLDLKAGALVGRHQHPNEQLSMVVSGCLELHFDDRVVTLRSGDMLLIPPDVPHAAAAIQDTIAVDLFSPVREDWQRGESNYFHVREGE
jgi:quercetin dioxygenase-like cupin family protein